MEQVTLRADARTERGTRPAKRLRREGLVPAIVYGRDFDATSVAVNYRELRAALTTEAGLNALINLEMGGKKVLTVARELQRHPVRGDIIHLDLVRISLTEAIQADVNIDYIGTPIGVIRDLGIVETIRTSVLVEALPTDVPSSIELEIGHLEIGDSLNVSDLTAGEGVTIVEDLDHTLVTVQAPRIEEEPVVEEDLEFEEGEEVEGEEVSEEDADDTGDSEQG